jgi:taurine dioxygenase
MNVTAGTHDTTSPANPVAPAIVRPSVRRHSIKVELCTPAIGAEPATSASPMPPLI